MPCVSFFLIVTAGSFLITGVAIAVAKRFHFVAHPVQRSSHDVPTPQVGGVGFCLTMLLVLPFLSRWIPSAGELRWLFFALIAYGFCIGLLDDFLALGALKKLLLLFGLALIPVSYLLFRSGGGVHLFYLAAFCFLWVVFYSNAFNFMDGVNGQSGVFTIQALGWFAWLSGGGDVAAICLVLAAAVLGFLIWNFPWGKTFMGDSGSLPLGATLAVLALLVSDGTWRGFLPPFLILLPYTYDVLYTLTRRLFRGENLLQAHRSHLYQRLLIASGWSHARLLAFHLPYFLAFGLLAVVFPPTSEAPRDWIFPVAAAIILLCIYTGMVWKSERIAPLKASEFDG